MITKYLITNKSQKTQLQWLKEATRLINSYVLWWKIANFVYGLYCKEKRDQQYTNLPFWTGDKESNTKHQTEGRLSPHELINEYDEIVVSKVTFTYNSILDW